jgi:hypothetical protein
MRCPACNAPQPDNATTCEWCSASLDDTTEQLPSIQWEVTELTIPMGFSSQGISDEEVIRRYDQIVEERLQQARSEGWQPADTVDFQACLSGGQIRWHPVGVFNPACQFESVTIRVRRPSQ